jgi:hypothetical protein
MVERMRAEVHIGRRLGLADGDITRADETIRT